MVFIMRFSIILLAVFTVGRYSCHGTAVSHDKLLQDQQCFSFSEASNNTKVYMHKVRHLTSNGKFECSVSMNRGKSLQTLQLNFTNSFNISVYSLDVTKDIPFLRTESRSKGHICYTLKLKYGENKWQIIVTKCGGGSKTKYHVPTNVIEDLQSLQLIAEGDFELTRFCKSCKHSEPHMTTIHVVVIALLIILLLFMVSITWILKRRRRECGHENQGPIVRIFRRPSRPPPPVPTEPPPSGHTRSRPL